MNGPRRFLVLTTLSLACIVGFSMRYAAAAALPPDCLGVALLAEDPVLLDHCVAAKSDPNVRARNGVTPLLLAMEKKDHRLVQRLLDLGANVDLPDQSGRTPLMEAARQRNTALVALLLERSIHPNATDSLGHTAAFYAIESRHHEAVEMLLPLAHSLNTPLEGGRDLLTVACDTGDLALIESVLKRCEEKLTWTPHTNQALRTAVLSGNKDFVRLLMEKHEGPPMFEGGNVPLLGYAIAADDRQLFTALLEAGADPNTVLPTTPDKHFVSLIDAAYLRSFVVSDSGLTVLMLASGLGREDYVRALLEVGAERFRKTEKHNMLALYFAARTKNWRCVQMLLGQGPSPEELRVEISLERQKASLIRNGVPILETRISTGRKGFATPAGEYVVTDKRRSHRSTIYHVPMPFFMRLNCLDFGLHAGAVPNYPASHGCIRLPSAAAQKIFSEIPVGTLVSIN